MQSTDVLQNVEALPKLLFLSVFMHAKNLNALRKYNHFISITIVSDFAQKDLLNYDYFYSAGVPIDVRIFPANIKRILFGPHVSVFPELKKLIPICGDDRVIYLQPSDWAADVWRNDPICGNMRLRIETLPFGVDTDTFAPVFSRADDANRNCVFIYIKNRNPREIEFALSFIGRNLQLMTGIPMERCHIFNCDNKYAEHEYLAHLRKSKFGIWIGAHESQGFALEEALACDVPLLVWNVSSMSQELKSNYDDIPATTIPYWDAEKCGESFLLAEELQPAFETFLHKLYDYRPRSFILQTLSVIKCEERMLQLLTT